MMKGLDICLQMGWLKINEALEYDRGTLTKQQIIDLIKERQNEMNCNKSRENEQEKISEIKK